MITGINESKPLTKHISFECKCKSDGTKRNSNQWWNKKKIMFRNKKIKKNNKKNNKKIMFRNLLLVIVKMKNIQQVL